ncbi:MAG TPA: sulfite exporter TauE/SafE family protein [Solirubrobacterales bacterium]|nr:sulfite exporter TauE/SafE family protein [Solirubrobacterales bacterium]
MLGDAILGAAVAFCLAVLTTPVGVSGAVFLVPFQISVVHTPSPALTPTNLLYNLIAIPGALFRFHREERLRGPLTRLLVLGTLPGVVAGAVIRVFLLDSGQAFLAVVAAVLIPLGAWLALGERPAPAGTPDLRRRRQILGLALAVGTIGGIYGIGGGSILGPILVGFGFSVLEVAPAALTATFLTSLAGVATYGLLSLGADSDIAPEWALGVGMGIGGLAGAYLGARLQSRLPEMLLRRGLGILALVLGARYLLQAVT